ncbi:hypothetical protein PENSPDRAFT_608901 [Peniophora sp. CONT]|nr:hypothetical protein PENSPDRAFT_608901 [Peniophora sp. CONT]
MEVLDEDTDTCRICSGGPEPSAPLYRPCLCRGSIGHIHQDCLATWLSHSKKRSCDVCKHPYAFTKVYAKDMPRRLPALLLMRRMIRHGAVWVVTGVRAGLVGGVWLALLPWATVWTWRMYFAIGNGAAGWLAATPGSGHRALFNLTRPSPSNATSTNSTTANDNGTAFSLLAHPAARNVGADILSGQIIATVIVLVFIAVFLLKEWIAQNARPGMLDDAPPPAPAQNAPPNAEVMEPEREGDLEEEIKKEMDAERARNALHMRQHAKARARAARNAPPALPAPTIVDATQRQIARLPRRARPVAALAPPPTLPLPPPPGEEGELGEEQARKRARAGVDFSFANEGGAPWLRGSPPLPFPLSPSTSAGAGPSTSGAGPSNANLRTISTTAVAGTPAATPGSASGPLPADWGFAPTLPAGMQRFEYSGAGTSGAVDSPRGTGPTRSSGPNAARNKLRRTARSRSPNRLSFRSTSSPTPTPLPPSLSTTPSAPIPSPRLTVPSTSTSSTPSSSSSTPVPGQPRPTKVALPRRPPLVSSAPASPALHEPIITRTGTGTDASASPGLASYAAPEVLGEEGYFDLARERRESGRDGRNVVVGGRESDETVKGKGKEEKGEGKSEEERVEVWSGGKMEGEGEDWVAWADGLENGDGDGDGGEDVDMRAEHARYFAEPTPPSDDDAEEVDEDMEGMPPLEPAHHDHDHEHEHDHDHEHEHHDDDVVFGWEDDDADVDGDGDDEGGDGIDRLEPDEIGIELLPPPPGGPFNPANANAPLPNPANPLDPNIPPNLNPPANGNFIDEFPPEAEDDMEGALEAIGMRGPLHIVAQNAALMVFVLDTAIGLGVWLPFTLGKTLSLLTLNPRRALVLLHAPVRMVRVLTDPGVDGAMFVVRRVIGPVLVRAVGPVIQLLKVEGKERGGFIAQAAKWVGALNGTALASAPTPASSATATSLLDSVYVQRVLAFPIVQKALSSPIYTDHIVPFTTRTWTSWTKLATSDAPSARASAVAIGYGAVGLGLVMWLNVVNVGSVRSVGRAVRDAVRQWVLVVKVAAFILIELVLFPLGCGLNLDACSVWMFPGASLQTRIAFARQSPLTSVFYHWVLGTMFMYQFAILLAGARTIMRPGAMWFIKDPSDANFHPIRDILERPALLQLRKLLFSALMYAAVLTAGVASVGAVARGLLPIRWRPREPLSDVPIDLLVLHVLLPYTMRHFRPKKPLKRFAGYAWRWAAARLGLSGYMFGARAPAEEKVPGGGWRRVPASDNVIVPRGARATAKVDVHGAAGDDEQLRIVAAQNLAARRAGRDPRADYTVVHVPTHFKSRIALFLTLLWIAGCASFALALSLPLLVGRQIFAIVLGSERTVHDGYSLLAGFYALWAAFFAGWHAEHRYLRRLRSSEPGQRVSRFQNVLRATKGGVVWACKAGYIAFMLGGVIPVLLAAVIEVYCVLPLRVLFTPGGEAVRVRVVDLWALGLVYLKILARGRLIRVQAQRAAAQNANNANNANGAAVGVAGDGAARVAGDGAARVAGDGAARRERGRAIARGVANIRARGWLRPDPVRATKEVIAPLFAGLAAMLAVPPLLAFTLVKVFGPRYVPVKGPLGYLQIYPLIFTGVALGQLISAGADVFVAWSRAVRDREYLVELRLRNFDQHATPGAGGGTGGGVGEGMEGVEERDVGADEIADDELALVARPL